MKILAIDLETSPNLAYVWGLWKQNVAINQIANAGEVISFAAKWLGKKPIEFHSVHNPGKQGMLERAHELLSEADVVIHWNGKSFDIPWIQQEFLLAGMLPPAPFQQIDLLHVVRKAFRFPSNKLDYVSQALGVGHKVKHSGFDLWLKCMADDPRAWAQMKTYNRQDVALLEELYDKLQPWITSHPHTGLIDGLGPSTCPNCGSDDLRREGFAYTQLGQYQRFQCRDCGRWSRSGRRIEGAGIRGVAA